MTKNILIYFIVIVIIGIGGWFFIQKSRNTSNNSSLDSLVKTNEPSPSANVDSNQEINNEWIKLENGLEYQDIVIGSADQEAKNGDKVFAHYTGTLENGSKFDSSYDRGEPFSFVLGGGMVIQGWDLGLLGMKVGGKRKLIIPPKLGYGDRNIGNGLIPPNSTLYFDIELMNLQ